MSQGGLAQTRRAKNEYMIQSLTTLSRCGDKDIHLSLYHGLTDIFIEQSGPYRSLDYGVFALAVSGDQTIVFQHGIASPG
jgi:hypothetical protein